jgi:3-phosphoshikimate 1-carboxyvinyltransferase
MQLRISPAAKLSGEIEVPSDKSISHRAVMLSSLAGGECRIVNFLFSEDCLRTAECFRAMGISIERENATLIVKGKGLIGLSSPGDILFAGNSGTTIRLMLGILAGQPFEALITGDESIKKRPMLRIVEPLRKMGAGIHGRENGNFAPIEIKGGSLKGIEYDLPVASAQIKSCLMLASLFAEGKTVLTEPAASRDHTERMFEHLGIQFKKDGNRIEIGRCPGFAPSEINIPSDISSAAFFMAAAAICPGSKVTLKNVGMNPTRTGIIDVLHRMGAKIEVENEIILSNEPRADITVSYSDLKAVELGGEIIPRIIDEIPIIAIAATQAEGRTVIKDAKELRVKESDRIARMAELLRGLGANVEETQDGMVIEGKTDLSGGSFDSHGDHRIAMSAAIAGLISKDGVIVENTDCINTSFPGFEDIFKKLIH